MTTTTTTTTTPEDATTVSWWVLAGWCWFVLSRGAERSSSVSGAWSLEFSTAPCYPSYCSSPARHVAMLVSLVIVNITGPTPTLASGHTPLLVTSQQSLGYQARIHPRQQQPITYRRMSENSPNIQNSSTLLNYGKTCWVGLILVWVCE